MRPPTDNVLVLGNLREYRHKYIALKLHSLGYISVAESMGVSSTTFT